MLARTRSFCLDYLSRHRPPGNEVALPFEFWDCEGQAHALSAASKQPVGKAKVAIRLGDHERQRKPERCDPNGRSHITAPAEYCVGLAPRQNRSSGRNGTRGEREGACRSQWIRAIEATDAQDVKLVASVGDERCLRPLRSTNEADLGAPSPQRVGDCQRGNYVPGCAARCYYDSGFCLIGRH